MVAQMGESSEGVAALLAWHCLSCGGRTKWWSRGQQSLSSSKSFVLGKT